MSKKLPYLNLGCGSHYNEDWVNVDFVSTGAGVIGHNLKNGIPFNDNSFEVVYHSHVLEHFTKHDGKKFLTECYRVLKPGGIIRVAIPDLQKIIEQYQNILSQLKQKPNDQYLKACYDWILLEMYDQTVRNKSGGSMAEYLQQPGLLNEDYILDRCGYEVKFIIDSYRNAENKNLQAISVHSPGIIKRMVTFFSAFRSLHSIKTMLAKKLLGKEYKFYELGKFKSGGEIHQWMYDEYSLSRLLSEIGFKNIRLCQPFESNIKEWNNFSLETVGGKIRKPDSLFMEASK